MNDDSSNADAALEEQLVAYLDGELDPEDGRRIEELLAADPKVRRSLQRLDRTWELLDELDTAPVGEKFTQSTLEMVTLAAAEEAEQRRAAAPRHRRRRWMIAGGGLLGAGLAGFLAVALVTPDPNRQLLRDLPVLQNLDQYRQIDDIEFLRVLDREGLFAEDSLTQRRQRIETMTVAEKEQLRRRQEQFAAFSPAEQQRLRRLHQQLQRDPDADQLRRVLDGYCRWLKTLPPHRQAELLELEGAERIKRIKRLCREQAGRGKRLGPEDTEGLLRWMQEYASRHEARLTEALPEARRQQLNKLNPQARRRMVTWLMWQRWQMPGPGKPPRPDDDDLADLRSKLSAATRKRLEGKPSAEQWRTIAGWIHQVLRHQSAARRLKGPLPPDHEKQLAHFFEHQLSDQQRDRLLSLPGDQMQRELRRLYMMHLRGPEPGHRGPAWPHRRRHPGPVQPHRRQHPGMPGPGRVHPHKPGRTPPAELRPIPVRPQSRPDGRSRSAHP